MNTSFFLRGKKLVACLVLWAAVSAVAMVEHGQAASLPQGIYIMQMADSDKTAAATGEAKNSRMILWNYRPTATWEFRHLGNDIYTVRTNSTYLEMRNRGGAVTIAPGNKQDSQKWRLKRVGNMYQLINVRTGQAMELATGQRKQGSQLQGNSPSGSRDQLFCIQKPRAPRFCDGSGTGGTGTGDSGKGNSKQGKKGQQDRKQQQDSLVEDMLQILQEGGSQDKVIRNKP